MRQGALLLVGEPCSVLTTTWASLRDRSVPSRCCRPERGRQEHENRTRVRIGAVAREHSPKVLARDPDQQAYQRADHKKGVALPVEENHDPNYCEER